jgi:hypothetical protein
LRRGISHQGSKGTPVEQHAPRRHTRRGISHSTALTAVAVTALAGIILLPAAVARAAAGEPQTDMFTKNDVFTVPAGVTQVEVTVAAAGGGGGGDSTAPGMQAWGGGGGGEGGLVTCRLTVTPGAKYDVVVGGAGGSGGSQGTPDTDPTVGYGDDGGLPGTDRSLTAAGGSAGGPKGGGGGGGGTGTASPDRIPSGSGGSGGGVAPGSGGLGGTGTADEVPGGGGGGGGGASSFGSGKTIAYAFGGGGGGAGQLDQHEGGYGGDGGLGGAGGVCEQDGRQIAAVQNISGQKGGRGASNAGDFTVFGGDGGGSLTPTGGNGGGGTAQDGGDGGTGGGAQPPSSSGSPTPPVSAAPGFGNNGVVFVTYTPAA